MSMRSPEENRGIHQATTLPNRGRGGIGVAEPRTAPGVDLTPKIKKKKANPILRGLMALGILTAGGAVAYETIPAVNQTANKAIERVFGDEVPSAFDNKLDKGVIGDNNIVRMTREEIQKLPDFDENGKPILLFPFTPPEGQAITFTKRYHGGYVHPDTEVDTETTRNSMDLKIPAGTTISSSGSGNVQMFFGGDYGDGTSERDSAIFVYKDKNGFIHRFIIAPNKKLGESNVLQSLVNAPAISKENSYGKEWEKGLTTSEGQKVTITLRDAEFTIAGLRGENPNSTYGHIVEDHLQFKTNFSGQLATSQG